MIVATGGAAVPLQLGEPLASWVLDPGLDRCRKMGPRHRGGSAGLPESIERGRVRYEWAEALVSS